MSIFCEIKSLYSSALSGWHSGKGHKYSKRGDYNRTLKHYLLAAKHTENTNNDGSMAIGLELIALTYFKLKENKQALVYAEKSLSHYKKCQLSGNSKAINEGIARVENLIENFNRITSH